MPRAMGKGRSLPGSRERQRVRFRPLAGTRGYGNHRRGVAVFPRVGVAPPRWGGNRILFLLGLIWGAALRAAEPTSVTTVTFVANAENLTQPRVRYTGRAWSADQGGYLVGNGRGHRLLAGVVPDAGDFRVELELSLPRAGRESTVVFGAESEIGLVSGAKTWRLKGRFFRAADLPWEIVVPEIKPGTPFSLGVERVGANVAVRVNGAVVHRGSCSAAAPGLLGLDPETGTVQLHTFSATGHFPAAGTPEQPFGNAFGLQLRVRPATLAAVRAPVIIREAPTNEPSLVARRDGTLELYSVTKPESDSINVIRSRDGGLTWGAAELAFKLPGRAYYAVVVIEAADGALHAVYHLLGEGPGGYRGRLYEVYHTRRPAGATRWTAPQRVVPGYVGSLNGFIQLSGRGRLVLAVGRAVPGREVSPRSGPDRGWNDTFVYLSDDQGATWRQSADVLSLELATPNVTRYGAIEPALLELRDGRVWMLVRDRGGRLWQTFSSDGEHWPALTRSPFISSDSPADLLRLRDGRIVLLTNACQNWTDPRSYAMGGREVLHAAISADEGKTWRGFREILHETNVVSGGDRGTSYATLAENTAGKVVVVSGQGEGKRAIALFDPAWLEESTMGDDLASGPVWWTQYGDEGLAVETLAGGGRAAALPLKSTGLCGALWNFPSAARGELTFRLWCPRETKALRFALNDHFNRSDDGRAAAHAVFELDWTTAAPEPAAWHDVAFRWSGATGAGELEVTVDGQSAGRINARRPAQFGVNYLRVEFRGTADRDRVLIADLRATASK